MLTALCNIVHSARLNEISPCYTCSTYFGEWHTAYINVYLCVKIEAVPIAKLPVLDVVLEDVDGCILPVV